MRISSYCKIEPREDSVKEALSLGWLSSRDEWTYRDPAELYRYFLNGLCAGGLDAPKMAGASAADVYLVEEPLTTGEPVWFNDRLAVLSTTNLGIEGPSHRLALIAIWLELWGIRKERICANNCVLSTGFLLSQGSKSEHRLCNACEDFLCMHASANEAVRIHMLALLLRRNESEAEGLLKERIEKAIKAKHLSFDDARCRIAGADMVLDNTLGKGERRRDWLKKIAAGVKSQEKQIKDRYVPLRHKFPKMPFMIASRRWNSWTPNQPGRVSKPYHTHLHKPGGGYLLCDGENTLAIDPGYGFLEMLHRFHGVSVMDIDGVLVTHDHPDHSSELRSILELRYEYRKQ